MSKLQKTEKIVLEILENQPETRKNDYLLTLEVWERLRPYIRMAQLEYVFTMQKELKLPSFKTIERCRRKIFETRKDLMDDTVTEIREKETEVYKEYARN